ncbi:MAG: fumarylacetoacetate hydrolase family protein [Candidatus Acidiferrales bacterium]
MESAGSFSRAATSDWDGVINADDHCKALAELTPCSAPTESELLPPIGSQEVWAAGVTYFRSRDARIEESKDSGGGDFYARVYAAQRPELFFKSAPYRVVGSGSKVRIRRDATWNVPEPELTLVIDRRGAIVGYTVGNDMSSRDIEGENPLYLPQAKTYDGSCALGPCVYLTQEPLSPDTEIRMNVRRERDLAFSAVTYIRNMKRSFAELVEYLYRETSFPHGCMLMTGTGIVPPNEFTLQPGDEIEITIPPMGILRNVVAGSEPAGEAAEGFKPHANRTQ